MRDPEQQQQQEEETLQKMGSSCVLTGFHVRSFFFVFPDTTHGRWNREINSTLCHVLPPFHAHFVFQHTRALTVGLGTNSGSDIKTQPVFFASSFVLQYGGIIK